MNLQAQLADYVARMKMEQAARNQMWQDLKRGRKTEIDYLQGAIIALADRHGVDVPLRGVLHRVVHRRGERGTVWTEISSAGDRVLCVAGEAAHLNRRVSDFLRREAARDLAAAVRRYARELGVPIRRISVRDQSSRWGSCSNTGALSFSWRLVLAPAFVLDYLAAHEVCHLVELNHSPRFWRLVERLYPELERAKVWLDVHGTDLHRYGLSARRATHDV